MLASRAAAVVAQLRILLVSTVDIAGGRHAELERLLQSVAASEPARKGHLQHLVLCQRSERADAEKLETRYSFVRVRAVPTRMSLSRARNELLEFASGGKPLAAADLVAFPDDDAWYPRGFLEEVSALIQREQASFFFCRYGQSPETAVDLASRPANLATYRDTVSCASSNTIVLRTNLARAVGPFDETLGVGTALGSGEDTDYAIRAFHLSPRTVWIDAKLVGHRDANADLRRRYYPGDLFVLARHARSGFGAFAMFLRKLAIGVFYGLTMQMPLGDLRQALRAALPALASGASKSFRE